MYRIIVALVLAFCFPVCAWACSCIGKSTVKEAISAADVVLSGKILSKNIFTVQDSLLLPGMKLRKAEYTIIVTDRYKGQATGDTVRLVTGLGNGDCGFEFSVGVDYIIYAMYENQYFASGSIVEKFLHTDICMRTRPVENNEGEIKALRRYMRQYNSKK